ncbi:peptidase domain-containing ABC transporter [Priestia filamentosa]|uniref:peptidase domain-containing ABC transporter n=1 Tax=Priestia filamentosa TaxID=1402861 RepID=UPI001C1DE5C7|nr:peptidase domain-containing ABC transporter [Priestia filamentosa]
MKNKTPLIMQTQQSECGLCCVAMVLNKYGNKKSIYELRNELTIGRDGLSLSILKNLLQRERMEAKIYKAKLEGIPHLQTPFIALWNNNHFVVVDRVRKNSFDILDPSIGRIRLKEEEFMKSFSGHVLNTQPAKNFEKKESSYRNPWFQLLANLNNKKMLCAGIIFFTFLSMLFQLLIPIMTQRFIDGFSIEGQLNTLSLFVTLALGFSISFLAINYCRGLMLNYLNVFLSKSITKGVFSHLLNLSFKFYDVRSPGDLLYRLNSVIAIRELISNSIIPGVVTMGTVFSIGIYLFYQSVTMGILVTVLVCINCMFLFLTRKKVSHAVDKELVHQSKSQSVMTETLYSMIFIKMSNMEKTFLKHWEKTFNKAVAAFHNRSNVQNAINSMSSSFQMLSPLLIMAYGFFLFMNGKLSLGEVIAIQTISATLFSQVNSLFSSYSQLIMADSYLKRILDITLANVDEKDELELLNEGVKIKKIQFKNVEFQYSDYSAPILSEISFEVIKGQKVGIVGKSGSGKSTLAKLLTGLYTNTNGEICINDIPNLKMNNRTLQKRIGIVPQDILLFNKSILENITMGVGDYSLEEVQRVAKIANIHEEIEKMPMGYHTVVSDMGMNLSGGQRQRITLARALIRKPEVLILDEATSSLDNSNERIISNYLKSLRCTTVVIAHRLSTIIDADKIIVLDKGKIIDIGTHYELIERSKFYRELYYTEEGSDEYAGVYDKHLS